MSDKKQNTLIEDIFNNIAEEVLREHLEMWKKKGLEVDESIKKLNMAFSVSTSESYEETIETHVEDTALGFKLGRTISHSRQRSKDVKNKKHEK